MICLFYFFMYTMQKYRIIFKVYLQIKEKYKSFLISYIPLQKEKKMTTLYLLYKNNCYICIGKQYQRMFYSVFVEK